MNFKDRTKYNIHFGRSLKVDWKTLCPKHVPGKTDEKKFSTATKQLNLHRGTEEVPACLHGLSGRMWAVFPILTCCWLPQVLGRANEYWSSGEWKQCICPYKLRKVYSLEVNDYLSSQSEALSMDNRNLLLTLIQIIYIYMSVYTFYFCLLEFNDRRVEFSYKDQIISLTWNMLRSEARGTWEWGDGSVVHSCDQDWLVLAVCVRHEIPAFSLPVPSVHGIFWARILEWVAISYARRSSWHRDWTRFFTTEPPGKSSESTVV